MTNRGMRWAAVACLLAVTGCAAAQRAEFDKAKADCRARFPAEAEQIVPRARCISDALERIAPNDPLTPLSVATRMSLAEKVHDGRMTLAEANESFARTMFEAQREINQERASRAAAAAAIIGAMPRYQPAPVPFYPMPVQQPWSATCTRLGDYTTCNGN